MEPNRKHGTLYKVGVGGGRGINQHGSIDWLSPETLVILILILVFAALMFTAFWTKIRGGILA